MGDRADELAAADALLRAAGFHAVAWADASGCWVGDSTAPSRAADGDVEFSMSPADPCQIEEVVHSASDLVAAVGRARAAVGGTAVDRG